MKRFSILLIAIIISACGAAPQAEPTIDPVELQTTAISAASTILAETQAAIPTATLPPPTATFTATVASTATFPPLPTLDATFTPNAVETSTTEDPCIYKVLPASLTGNKIKIRVDNPTKATINLSIYLQSGNPQGVCGYRAFTLAQGDSLVVTDLVEGCYTLWAWNPEPKDYFIVTNGTSCLDNSSDWTFHITPNDIQLGDIQIVQ